ncbi:MAG: chemotaxis protein CheA [Desulfovibrionaceae bacterium]|nr:chemotaxis protein CheA [Desulfovibrionaceae bacterium]
MMYDSEELLQDFIIEAKEHLESIEPNILRLEKEPEHCSEILNEIFRPMHSLKGASGFLGLEKINSLAHKAESVLDELRKGAMNITSEITDAILVTTDVLGKIVEHLEEHGVEGDIDTGDISEVLQRILSGEEIASTQGTNSIATATGSDTSSTKMISESIVDIEKAKVQFLENPENAEYVTLLLTSLRALLEEVEKEDSEDIIHAIQNTIEIIEKTQTKGMDFTPLLPLLEQELAIIIDLSKELFLQQETAGQHCINALQRALDSFMSEPSLVENVDVLYDVLSIAKKYAEECELDDAAMTAKNTAEIIRKAKEDSVDITSLVGILSQEVSILIELLEQSSDTQGETQEDIVSSDLQNEGEQHIVKEQNATVHKEKNKKEGQQQKDTKESDKVKHNGFIRVDHHKLDQLMNLIGELIITRNRYSLLVRSLEDEERTVKDIARIAQSLTETTSSMARISDALQDTIMQVRMVSLSATFSRLPRLVRDISKKSGKEVELHIVGEETELDKNMVEALADPLLHLIRNAVDHGIESPEERLHVGKPEKGNVWIRAFHKGNSVVIEIEDDGKGMDPERLKEVALEKGLITPDEAKFITNDQAFELIFLPGFSSAKEITDISGRGVGMDVVRTNIKGLKGTISIHSVLGSGSIFTLSFPLTLAIIEALMVEVRGQTFAIPLDTVSETTKISKVHIKKIQDIEAITLRGEVLSIVHLADKLGFAKEHTIPDIISVVIVTINNKKVGFIVDKLLERQEIVIKSLGNYPIVHTGISGATITGDGGVILIINPHDIYTMSTRKSV